MDEKAGKLDDLDNRDLARFVIDMCHRIVMHHALWFKEVEHQMGFERALEILDSAYRKSYGIQMNRLGKTLGFEMEDDIPHPLLDMDRDKLMGLIETLGVNWLANDGVWFQSVEFTSGMDDAKRCNDTCWTRFAAFEAWSIKRFLGIAENSGLEGLKKVLNFRMYSRINTQTIVDESENVIRFEMNDCRVQSSRKRKGLPDYPCKSAGTVEYTSFARGVDKRIRTECIGCPPDEHPDEWFCAWRFTLE